MILYKGGKIKMQRVSVPEEELVAFAKTYLKEKGFKKKNKKWTKTEEEFTLVFYIQGSQWDKDDYYIRPGVFINELNSDNLIYGHFMTEIEADSIEQIFNDLNVFFNEYTNKKLLKERVISFVEWDKRNPLEKRRADEVDYVNDPMPFRELFAVPTEVLKYVIENF